MDRAGAVRFGHHDCHRGAQGQAGNGFPEGGHHLAALAGDLERTQQGLSSKAHAAASNRP